MQTHRETLEEEATHATDEARMLLPGVQAVLGFQLVAVTNNRFTLFTQGEQILFLVAFVLLALAMGLIMAPAAYHRQAGRGKVTRHFVDLASRLLTIAMLPLIVAFSLDTYLVARLILDDSTLSGFVASAVAMILAALWYALPMACRRSKG
jgi:cobalamin synthase